MQRPQFLPSHICTECLSNDGWLPVVNCLAGFPLEIFEAAISQLIHHPEYNSTLILRTEILCHDASDFPEIIPSFQVSRKIRYIHRRLLPRRPERDAPLDQFCTLYASDQSPLPHTLVLTPFLESGATLPYYHPAVCHLALRYLALDPPLLQIEVVPLPNTPTDLNSRLFRICLSLLETLHKYGWGALTNYKKRVLHDRLVPRESYQDLYLIMRQRHKHLIDSWQEVTDPLKHVFEDIGIATFLMLLWKVSFSSSEGRPCEDDSSEPWRNWPRPCGGFLDLGCGNGLLTHILISEGYSGVGLDLRARTSWHHYPPTTQAALEVHALDPTTISNESVSKYFNPGVFIIGNHADELTPWIPVVSTLCDASGYISIPCCSWSFDVKYDRSSVVSFPIHNDDDFKESLNLGGDGTYKSSYSMYRIWLASLSMYCGWEVECEVLRIPSTRNWAIVGRKRHVRSQAFTNVKGIIEEVKLRGIFQTRKPEGNDH